MTTQAYICDYARTPIGRYAGALAAVRPDDLAAHTIRALTARHPGVDWSLLDEVILGCANQAGEDNRNVARMALLLAGLPCTTPGVTVNRLCASGLQAVAAGVHAIASGQADLILAGGVESMSRAPLVMPKPAEAFSRHAEIHDTTLGWRFINPAMKAAWGVDPLAETAENLAQEFAISRVDQDRFALASQSKALAAQSAGRFTAEIAPVPLPARKGPPALVALDEHPRSTTLDALAALRPITRPEGSVTAGNSTGVNDGAACLLLASEEGARRAGLRPIARVLGSASVGVEPRRMGIGPVPATRRLLERLGLALAQIELIELNEAFAAQSLACLRQLGLSDVDPRVNPLGGAIALGHPLGMSGARLVGTAALQLQHAQQRLALCTMCVGVGQGMAMVIERVA